MYDDVFVRFDSETGDPMPLTEVRCTAPGRFRHYHRRICGKMGAQSKITQKMTGTLPADSVPQPMWLCKDHWGDYPEVSAISGERQPARNFPK